VTADRSPLPRLIAQLARDATPVTPLPPPSARWMTWALKAAAAAAIVTILLGLRPDVDACVHDPRFVAAALATLALALTAAAGAFALSVPGAGARRAVRACPLLAAAAWATLLWLRLTAAGGEPITQLAATPWHPACVLLILSVGTVPGIWLFAMLRRAAPLQPLWTGALAALASLALGALGTQFVCPIDAPGHQVLWHFTPVVLITFVGLALGARLFDWRRLATGTFRSLR
jgi:hypothetical protein